MGIFVFPTLSQFFCVIIYEVYTFHLSCKVGAERGKGVLFPFKEPRAIIARILAE